MKNKIAILLGSPAISGGTYVIFQHALALKKHGYEVTIITEKKFDKNILSWFPDANELNFIDLKSASNEYYSLCIATWWKTVFYLPEINASKFVYFVQSIESKFFKKSDYLIQEIIESSYDIPFYYITEAHWIQNYLKDKHKQTSKLVLNGIDKNIFNTNGMILDKTRRNGTRVLVEGALNVFFKQTELAIEVAKKAGVKDIWLVTPTKIKEFPGVSKTFSEVPLKKVGEIMRSCDIILKLSKVEGMFGPPLEMMHCGGTAVTFDVTGYDEYIEDGINGLVYPMGDIEGITEGLSKLLKDEKFLNELKNNSLETAEKWPNWEESNDCFIENITLILKDKNIQNTDNIKNISNFLKNFYVSEDYINNSIKLTFKRLIKNIYNRIKSIF